MPRSPYTPLPLPLKLPKPAPFPPYAVETTTQVYFVESAGLVKIGKTQDVHERMNMLRGSCATPVKLLAFYEANWWEEQRLHRLFATARAHHEWFHAVPALVKLIDTIRAGGRPDGWLAPVKPFEIPQRMKLRIQNAERIAHRATRQSA